MEASGAIINIAKIETALSTCTFHGPSWASKDSRRTRVLWAVTGMSSVTKGILTIVEDSDGDEMEYRVAWLTHVATSVVAFSLEANFVWPLQALRSLECASAEPATAAAAHGFGLTDGADLLIEFDSNGQFGQQLLSGSTVQSWWRCTLDTPAVRDEACWRMLAAARVLAGCAPLCSLEPSDLGALATALRQTTTTAVDVRTMVWCLCA
jgi:hypothetical protein